MQGTDVFICSIKSHLLFVLIIYAEASEMTDLPRVAVVTSNCNDHINITCMR